MESVVNPCKKMDFLSRQKAYLSKHKIKFVHRAECVHFNKAAEIGRMDERVDKIWKFLL